MPSTIVADSSLARPDRRETPLHLGLGGIRRHACAAVADEHRVLAVCEQERMTRVRGAGVNSSGLPDEAIAAVLASARAQPSNVHACGIAEQIDDCDRPWKTARFEHHEAHAASAYLTSPFEAATVLVCDDDAPGVSVWIGSSGSLLRADWPWTGPSPSDLYLDCARLMGFAPPAGPQRFEALARMMAGAPDPLPTLFTTDGLRVAARAHWRSFVETSSGAPFATRARTAAALQDQIAALMVEIVRRLREAFPSQYLCLGGSLFHHASINAAIRLSGLYHRVFVPPNPGNAGLAVGSAALLANLRPSQVSAFLGPSYEPDDVKATLDNCKLRYDWLGEGDLVQTVVGHLRQGRLVGWFEGRMEWGPRALGGRSTLANPFAPYVLENLNTFLKGRETWRGYAVSVPEEHVDEHFAGPAEAPFMECDYRPNEPKRFLPVLPAQSAYVRLQTVTADSPPRFRSLLAAFGEATGVPCLVNTSFNGFHEPIVCTPRDAVRVFFGSGLDVLVLDRFVLTK